MPSAVAILVARAEPWDFVACPRVNRRPHEGWQTERLIFRSPRAIEGPVITAAAGARLDQLGRSQVRRGRSSPAKVEGAVVNSIQTSFVSERMIDLIEAAVAFDRGAGAKWPGVQL